MIDISKIKVESKRVDYECFEHVAGLVITGVVLRSTAECQADARKEAKLRLWREVYGDLDDLVREVAIAGHHAASIISPQYLAVIDKLRHAVEKLAKQIQYPYESTTPIPPRPV